jgi:hypothetical protein
VQLTLLSPAFRFSVEASTDLHSMFADAILCGVMFMQFAQWASFARNDRKHTKIVVVCVASVQRETRHILIVGSIQVLSPPSPPQSTLSGSACISSVSPSLPCWNKVVVS